MEKENTGGLPQQDGKVLVLSGRNQRRPRRDVVAGDSFRAAGTAGAKARGPHLAEGRT